MGVFTGYDGLAAHAGLRDISFNIAGRQPLHPAQDSHGGGEIGAVAFAAAHKKARDKVNIHGLILHIEGVSAVAGQPGLKRKGLLIRGFKPGGYFIRQIVERLFKMGWQGCVGFDPGFP